eukprot:1266084-Rhodomonas_salina.1
MHSDSERERVCVCERERARERETRQTRADASGSADAINAMRLFRCASSDRALHVQVMRLFRPRAARAGDVRRDATPLLFLLFLLLFLSRLSSSSFSPTSLPLPHQRSHPLHHSSHPLLVPSTHDHLHVQRGLKRRIASSLRLSELRLELLGHALDLLVREVLLDQGHALAGT